MMYNNTYDDNYRMCHIYNEIHTLQCNYVQYIITKQKHLGLSLKQFQTEHYWTIDKLI